MLGPTERAGRGFARRGLPVTERITPRSALGARAATAVVAVGVAYAAVLALGMWRHGLSEPIGDPILAVMELLTIASAVPILLLFVALHDVAAPATRRPAIVSVVAATLFALTTTGVHAFELTAGRAMGSRGLVWPSTSYAVELVAWDLLLGIALLAAAAALRAEESARSVRCGLHVTGWLCIVGLLGPAVGNMRLQLIGVFGYAVLLPLVAWLWGRWFRTA